MKKLLLFIITFSCLNVFSASYVRGKIYVQEQYNQTVDKMLPFKGRAQITAIDAHPQLSDPNGDFKMTFNNKPSGTSVSLSIDEGKLSYGGKSYEIVNINDLLTVSMFNQNQITVRIIVCQKGFRESFIHQMANQLFKKSLSKATDNEEQRALLYRYASLSLGKQLSSLSKEHQELISKLDNGDYFGVKPLLKSTADKAFDYIRLSRSTQLKHESLYNESIRSIHSYIFSCQLTGANTEALETAKRLYDLDRTNAMIITMYANILRYVEEYEKAKNVYYESLNSKMDAEERAKVRYNFGTLLNHLELADEALAYFLGDLGSITSNPFSDADSWSEVMNSYFEVGNTLQFDTCIYYYQKAIDAGKTAIRKLADTSKEDDLQQIDSSILYHRISECFRFISIFDRSYSDSINYYDNLSRAKSSYSIGELPNSTEVPSLENILKQTEKLGNSYERAKILLALAEETCEKDSLMKKKEICLNYVDEAILLLDKIKRADLPFRKLRIMQADAQKIKGAFISHYTGNRDTVVYYYLKALDIYTNESDIKRQVCSKEIATLSKEIFEWLLHKRAPIQGLTKNDEELRALLPRLDAMLLEIEKHYLTNKGKYREIVIAAHLYACGVFMSSDENEKRAHSCARRVIQLCNDQGWLDSTGMLTNQGATFLYKELFYVSNICQLMGNVHWILDEPDKAYNYYLEAQDENRTEFTQSAEILYLLPKCQLLYKLGDFNASLGLAKAALRPENQLADQPLITVHAHLMAVLGYIYIYEPLKAKEELNAILQSDLSNYSFSEKLPFIELMITIQLEDYHKSVELFEKIMESPGFIDDPDTKLTGSHLYAMIGNNVKVNHYLRLLTKEDLLTLDSSNMIQYYALKDWCAMMSKDKLDNSENERKEQLMINPENEFNYYLTLSEIHKQNSQISKLKKELKKMDGLCSLIKSQFSLGKYHELKAELMRLKGKTEEQKDELLSARAFYSSHRKGCYDQDRVEALLRRH